MVQLDLLANGLGQVARLAYNIGWMGLIMGKSEGK